MPTRIGKPDRVIVRIAVPIPRLWIPRLRDDGIRRNKPAEPGAVPARVIPVQAQAALFALARVTECGLGGAVGVTRFAPRFVTHFRGFTAAAGGGDAGRTQVIA